MNTTEFLEIACAIEHERTAIVFEGRRTTYAELKGRVSRLANALGELGVGAGDRVAMIEVNRPEHIEAYFATAALDAVFVPLNYRSRGDEHSGDEYRDRGGDQHQTVSYCTPHHNMPRGCQDRPHPQGH